MQICSLEQSKLQCLPPIYLSACLSIFVSCIYISNSPNLYKCSVLVNWLHIFICSLSVTIEGCGGSLNATSQYQWVTSPGTNWYVNNLICDWIITAQQNLISLQVGVAPNSRLTPPFHRLLIMSKAGFNAM